MRANMLATGFRIQTALFATILLTNLFLVNVLCIRFFIQPHQKRCLKHEMYTNQLATGEYEISEMPGTVIDMSITDSKGHVALSRDNVDGKGKFAVSSDSADFYDLCFSYTVSMGTDSFGPREISVEYKVGVEAKTYENVDHDKLSELGKDLTRIDDLTNAIIMDFAHLKRREKEMRDTNESTNTRVFYQSLTSVIVLLVLALWQILYLKTFFRAKKLID